MAKKTGSVIGRPAELSGKLTDMDIHDRQYTGKVEKLSDGHGLFLLINESGKYWRYSYRFNGKQRTLAIGPYPALSLAEARKAHAQAQALLRDNVDPCAHKQRQRRDQRLDAENTFRAVSIEWINRQAARWSKDHPQRVLRSLELWIFPEIGSTPIKDIKPADVLQAVRKIESQGKTETAGRVLQRVSAAFRYAVITGRCVSNPAADLQGALTPHVTNHQAALPLREFPEFFRKLRDYKGRPETRIAIELLILTFVRTVELREAEWGEVDIKNQQMIIPAARMKMRREHIVPLSKQSLSLLSELRELTGAYRFLFPSSRNHLEPMSENTILYALYRLGYHSRATGHGFRTCASTWLHEEGYDPDHIERQLAHVPANAIRGIYNKAQYLEHRRKLMQAWADAVDSMKHQ